MSSVPDFHALLIGPDYRYNPRLTTLTAPIADVMCINAILADPRRGAYPPANLHALIGAAPTAAALRAAFQMLAGVTTPYSTVFIFFSGHGMRLTLDGQQQVFLCPADADPLRPATTMIAESELSDALAAIPAQRMVVVCDACHAGGLVQLKGDGMLPEWHSGFADETYARLSRGSGRLVLASSKLEQYSVQHEHDTRSLFTTHLCAALDGAAAVRGDGFVHILDVFDYVSLQVQREEPEQMPILKAEVDLNFPIAFHQGGPNMMSPAPQPSARIAEIRAMIVRDPIQGAKALSDYAVMLPNGMQWRSAIDLQRNELERIQKNEDLFLVLSDTDKALQRRAVFALFKICTDIEQAR